MVTITTDEGDKIVLTLRMILVHNWDWLKQTLMGNCGHGVSLLDRCFDCICADNLQRYEEMRRNRGN